VDCSDDPYLSWPSEVYCPLPMELRFANGKQLPIADLLIRQFRKNSRAAGLTLHGGQAMKFSTPTPLPWRLSP
jgi:hypothetical protein